MGRVLNTASQSAGSQLFRFRNCESTRLFVGRWYVACPITVRIVCLLLSAAAEPEADDVKAERLDKLASFQLQMIRHAMKCECMSLTCDI